MAKKDEAVAKKEDQSLATAGFENYEFSGFENQTKEDTALPFLAVLQAMSPQLETDERAKAGMIINTVTGDLWSKDQGLIFVPVITQHHFVEWVPRERGGGFVAIHELDSDVVKNCRSNQDFGKYKVGENDLVESFYVYGLIVDENENIQQAVLGFKSTGIKKYKNWMTKARNILLKRQDGTRYVAPLFSHRYRVRTVKERNTKGEFYNFDIMFDGENAEQARLSADSSVVENALGLLNMIKTGQKSVDYEGEAKARQGESTDNEEVPF